MMGSDSEGEINSEGELDNKLSIKKRSKSG